MKSKAFILLAVSLVSPAQSRAGMQVGTPASILDALRAENLRASSVYALPDMAGGSIQVDVEDYYFQGGELSMSGRARESRNSLFILKGNSAGLYGWVVLKDRNVAYEYTTDASGAVVAEAVPVTDIIPVCGMPGPASGTAGSASGTAGQDRADMNVMPAADSLTPHIGAYPNSNVNKLQSLPGAKKVMYMDITRVMNGDTPKYISKAEMWKTWQSLAAALSMYNVNVTTDAAVYAAAGVANSGIARFLDEDGRSNAPLNSFGTTRYSSMYKDPTGYGYGRTVAHEVGHQLGLSHDGGTPGGEYYSGIPAYQWTPLMGNYWPGNSWTEALYQWSKGEYTSASTRQDDLALINKHLEFRADDITGTIPLKMQGTLVPVSLNRGQIGRNDDEDAFAFRITSAGGRAKLKINRIEYIGGAMLDVEARILDAGGNEVAKDNRVKARFAEFDTPLAAGDYTLVIKGGAEGTPANGFSDYSSLGFYAIEGEITGGATGLADSRFAAETAAAAVRVSPVSADGSLKLGFPENARVGKIALFSTSGAVVYQSRVRVDAIDVGGLPAGLYILSMAVEGNTVVKRIVRR